RAWIDGLQSEEERQCRQRPLAAGEQRQWLQPLAGRLCQDLDAIIERVAFLLGLHPQRRAAALEEFRKEFLEVDRHRLENGAKAGVDLIFEPLPELVELRGRGLQVAQLRRQAVAAVAHLCKLLRRE